MNTAARVIKRLFKQLESTQVAVLEDKDSEKAQKHLKWVMEALQRTIIKKEA